MKKSFQIFKRDLGRLFRNRAAVLILVGISVLPSLYAWFNTAANMDPYGNTKGIQVAIANEDKGADSEQMSLDAGQNIVDNLKKSATTRACIFASFFENCRLVKFILFLKALR